jgi:hypothetical protein
MMLRTTLRYTLDAALYAFVSAVFVVGLILAVVVPRGPGGNKDFLGLHRHAWADIHLYLSLVFITLCVLHLLLNWGWIRRATRLLFGGLRDPHRSRIAIAMLALSWLPLLFICWLLAYL